MAQLSLATAIKHVNKQGMLLVFPQANSREPASLWYQFFPRTAMRWEWDSGGDSRVSDLWFLREKLSTSRKVIYSKWFRGRATLTSLDLTGALIRLLNPTFPRIQGLSFTAQEILDVLNEDSPVSTKQLKKLTDLQGKDSESKYQRALKELWSRLLVVVYGEVDEGAFPSIAVGSTQVLFEDVWRQASELNYQDALSTAERLLPSDSPFDKFLKRQLKQNAAKIQTEVTHEN
jgi:hypothetical protein